MVIALDVGGTKVAAALVEADGTLRKRRQEPTRPEAGPEALIATLIRLAVALSQEAPAVQAIGVGSAGQIDFRTGRVIYANENLPGWTGMPIAERLQATLGLPTAVDNDVHAMALGEAAYGAALGYRVVIVVAVGTGIGGAVVLDGQLFRGATGVAGELGHTPLEEDGPLCACGRRACLEVYAAGPRIAAAYARAAGLHQPLDLSEVAQRARSGDQHAREAFLQAGHHLGRGLAGLVNTLNPDALIVGGGVAAAGPLLLVPLERTLRERAQGPAGSAVTIALASLGADAGLLGAAVLARGLLP
jgi:glucokinase